MNVQAEHDPGGQPQTFIALLYSIMLPGGARLKMADLREMASGLGFTNARTVGSTGNLVFETAGETARQSISGIEQRLEKAYAERFGKKVPIIILNLARLRALVDEDPFGPDGEGCYIYIRVMRDGYDKDVLEQLAPYVENQTLALTGDGDLWIAFGGKVSGSRLSSALSTKRFASSVGTFRTRAMLGKIAAAAEKNPASQPAR